MKKLLILTCFFLACNDNCEPANSKCEGDTLLVCNQDKNWEKAFDCQEIEALDPSTNWVCCEDPEDGELACLPEGECK